MKTLKDEEIILNGKCIGNLKLTKFGITKAYYNVEFDAQRWYYIPKYQLEKIRIEYGNYHNTDYFKIRSKETTNCKFYYLNATDNYIEINVLIDDYDNVYDL